MLGAEIFNTALLFCKLDETLTRGTLHIGINLIPGRENERYGDGVVLRRVLLTPVAARNGELGLPQIEQLQNRIFTAQSTCKERPHIEAPREIGRAHV